MSGTQWSDFGIRTVSALVLGPLVLFALWRGHWAWEVLLAVGFVGLGAEWAVLTRPRGAPAWLSAALPAGLLVVQALSAWAGFPVALVALALLTLGVLRLAGRFAGWGVPYIGIGCLALLWLRLGQGTGDLGIGGEGGGSEGSGWVDTAFLVSVVWATDIGAYVAGRWVGGRKLAPRISPGKTWSGAAGGLFLAGWIGWLFAMAASGGGGFGGFLAALGLSVMAQGGDLLESAIKRKLGVKDSGRTIPGHGGLFDRLDGFLTAAPLAAILAYVANIHAIGGGLPLWR